VLGDRALDLRARLGRTYGCVEWSAPASAPHSSCTPRAGYLGELEVVRGADGAIETVQFNIIKRRLVGPRRPHDEVAGRARAAVMVATLLPSWRQGPGWVRNVIRGLTDDRRRRAIRVGGTAVLVQLVEPSGGPDTILAYVTVSRSADLEQWNYNATMGSWSDLLSHQRGR
jgi:hypothetical protein